MLKTARDHPPLYELARRSKSDHSVTTKKSFEGPVHKETARKSRTLLPESLLDRADSPGPGPPAKRAVLKSIITSADVMDELLLHIEPTTYVYTRNYHSKERTTLTTPVGLAHWNIASPEPPTPFH